MRLQPGPREAALRYQPRMQGRVAVTGQRFSLHAPYDKNRCPTRTLRAEIRRPRGRPPAGLRARWDRGRRRALRSGSGLQGRIHLRSKFLAPGQMHAAVRITVLQPERWSGGGNGGSPCDTGCHGRAPGRACSRPARARRGSAPSRDRGLACAAGSSERPHEVQAGVSSALAA
jgi:hypothetical protein